MAIAVKSADTIRHFLQAKKSGLKQIVAAYGKRLNQKGFDCFFIEYADKHWKDSKINTTHFNGAISLASTYIIDTDQQLYAKKYISLGFSEISKGAFSGIARRALLIGKSNLYFIKAAEAKRISSRFKSKNHLGIAVALKLKWRH